ncbi:FtsK/SpoIIIE domain-containing protein [Streptomyces aidingensis]|uniref:Inner membrane component of T3SS domain-containing protein n=1 Tax=Streptomyces aidingensis TaxID=910347 RepID=A0A1I1DXQ5_9ACTN|nr:FtsK/SpoIIIE domain-containing protein [Streptomyces aidingensis]SFB79715.1 Inner membrane component of T3SS domain-containing protein [Streptomyces aidingensis]
MQIWLTVLGPQGGAGTDVTVTAAAGTPLAEVLGELAAAAAPGGGAPGPVYCGSRRLDPAGVLLGRPPLVDGAVLAFQRPVEPAGPHQAPARLLVVSGPDAGGVHLLHGGEIRIGRSSRADVPLDDPDVSRLHCEITVAADGSMSVRDLGSTNGTALVAAPWTGGGVAAARPVSGEPVPLPPGGELRIGESVLRIAAGTAPPQAPPPPSSQAPPPPPSSSSSSSKAPAPAPVPRPGRSAPPAARRRGGLAGLARRLGAPRPEGSPAGPPPLPPDIPPAAGPAGPELPALLLTALGLAPGAAEAPPVGGGLWATEAAAPQGLTVRLGTAQQIGGALVPVSVSLATAGALGLAGPRHRLLGLARSVLAQLAALHPPSALEIVALARGRAADWAWLGWLPHTRPLGGQDCHRLLAFDREQATARIAELTGRPAAARGTRRTVVLVDGDPGGADLRAAVERLAEEGPAAGVHPICLAEAPAATATSPVADTLAAARDASPVFGRCGAMAVLAGEVATTVRLLPPPRGTAGPAGAAPGPAGRSPAPLEDSATHRTDPTAAAVATTGGTAAWPGLRPATGAHRGGDGTSGLAARDPGRHAGSAAGPAAAPHRAAGPAPGARPPGGGAGTVDAVSAAWAERFARALAPLREESGDGTNGAAAAPLPDSARLLDLLELPRVTPAALGKRWRATGGGLPLLLGAGPAGPVVLDLAAEPGPLRIEGGPGSGKTELLCALAASLTAARSPRRLSLLLVDGPAGGLAPCAELPHVTEHVATTDPVRMRAFAESLREELKRRAAERPARVVTQRRAGEPAGAADPPGPAGPPAGQPPALVVLVDDLEALLSPALGAPGRPAAGSVVRSLDAVAREGGPLGVHLITASGRSPGGGASVTETPAGMAVAATASVSLAGRPPGRAELRTARLPAPVLFQAGRVTGRIPRTATLRPTVIPLDWRRAGDPPARRPVRELGNGPTDVALLASAAARAGETDQAAAASLV